MTFVSKNKKNNHLEEKQRTIRFLNFITDTFMLSPLYFFIRNAGLTATFSNVYS